MPRQTTRALVPCPCRKGGLDSSPYEACWISGGSIAEVRRCSACSTHRTWGARDVLLVAFGERGAFVRPVHLYESKWTSEISGEWRSLTFALDALIEADDGPFEGHAAMGGRRLPVDSELIRNGVTLARVLRNGAWLRLPPVDEGPHLL